MLQTHIFLHANTTQTLNNTLLTHLSKSLLGRHHCKKSYKTTKAKFTTDEQRCCYLKPAAINLQPQDWLAWHHLLASCLPGNKTYNTPIRSLQSNMGCLTPRTGQLLVQAPGLTTRSYSQRWSKMVMSCDWITYGLSILKMFFYQIYIFKKKMIIWKLNTNFDFC